MLVGILRVLLGLGRMFLALGVVVAAVSRGRGTMRLCCGFVMFRRCVVCIFHVKFSCWPKNLGGLQKAPQSWSHSVSNVFFAGLPLSSRDGATNRKARDSFFDSGQFRPVLGSI